MSWGLFNCGKHCGALKSINNCSEIYDTMEKAKYK